MSHFVIGSDNIDKNERTWLNAIKNRLQQAGHQWQMANNPQPHPCSASTRYQALLKLGALENVKNGANSVCPGAE